MTFLQCCSSLSKLSSARVVWWSSVWTPRDNRETV